MLEVGGRVKKFEPCATQNVTFFKCSSVKYKHVRVQRTQCVLTPFNCYCAHKCATLKNHMYYLSATIYCDYLFSIIHSRVYIPQDMYVYMCKEKRMHHIIFYNMLQIYKKVAYKQTVSGYV